MADGSVGFVLAGGGTKGAFEVGAVGHLVASGLVPDVLTSASAGSIVGAKLAQGRGRTELAERAAELRHDLLAMTDLATVFGRQPWLDDLAGTPIGQAVDAFVQRRPDPPPTDDPLPGDDAAGDGGTSSGARRHHRHRRWHALGELLGSLGPVDHARHDTAGHLASFLTLDPLGHALRGDAEATAGIAALDAAAVARPGLELRLAVTAMALGVTRYVTGTGQVVEADARTPCPDHPDGIDLVEAVLTSSSAPMVFPPRLLDGQVYADGGITENLPVAAAAALGATRIVAVMATPRFAAVDGRDLTQANLLAVHLRAAEVAFYASQRASAAAALPPGTTLDLIAPTVDLVGAFEVNEGLMRIDMDYGALRAQETLADLDPVDRRQAERLTDRVVVARDRAWFLEERCWSSGAADAAVLDDVRALKAAVHQALADRADLGLATPSGASAWSDGWEAHAATRPDALPERP